MLDTALTCSAVCVTALRISDLGLLIFQPALMLDMAKSVRVESTPGS